MGRGLKYRHYNVDIVIFASPHIRGARIEIESLKQGNLSSNRRLTYVGRGLKSFVTAPLGGVGGSPHIRGARIEI